MMNIEDQVVSLELAKRLKELGIKQNSLFSWQIGINLTPTLNLSFIGEINCIDISAFTVAELGEILPKEIIVNTIHYYYTQIPCKDLQTWSIFYRNDFSGMPDCDQYYISESDARAKMLIHLIENGYMKKDLENATGTDGNQVK